MATNLRESTTTLWKSVKENIAQTAQLMAVNYQGGIGGSLIRKSHWCALWDSYSVIGL